jgi:DNA-binding MarR family transcriptional regulator
LAGRDAEFGDMIALMYAALARFHTMRRMLAKSLQLSSAEFAVIITLYRAREKHGLRVRQIADELFVAATNVTATITNLERAGWVLKSPDPRDSRAVAIQLAPKAKQRLNRFAARLLWVNDLWFQGTTKNEFTAVLTFLRHVIAQYPPAIDAARELVQQSKAGGF